MTTDREAMRPVMLATINNSYGPPNAWYVRWQGRQIRFSSKTTFCSMAKLRSSFFVYLRKNAYSSAHVFPWGKNWYSMEARNFLNRTIDEYLTSHELEFVQAQ